MNLKNGIESYLLLLLLTKMMHIGWKTSEEWCYGRSGGTTTTTTRTRTISTATCVFTCCSSKGENNRNRKCETPVAPSNVIWIVPCSHASAASPESIRASGTTWVSPSWSKISNEKILFWRSWSTRPSWKSRTWRSHMRNCYNDFVLCILLITPEKAWNQFFYVLLTYVSWSVPRMLSHCKVYVHWRDCILTVSQAAVIWCIDFNWFHPVVCRGSNSKGVFAIHCSVASVYSAVRSWIETNLPGSFQISVIPGNHWETDIHEAGIAQVL